MAAKISWPQGQEQLIYLRATQGSKGSEHPQNVAAGLAYSSMQNLITHASACCQRQATWIFNHMQKIWNNPTNKIIRTEITWSDPVQVMSCWKTMILQESHEERTKRKLNIQRGQSSSLALWRIGCRLRGRQVLQAILAPQEASSLKQQHMQLNSFSTSALWLH